MIPFFSVLTFSPARILWLLEVGLFMILPLFSVLVQVVPMQDVKSSHHLPFCLLRGCHFVTHLIHLLSSLLARWPDRLHLASLIFRWLLLVFASFFYVRVPNSVFHCNLTICLSIALWAVLRSPHSIKSFRTPIKYYPLPHRWGSSLSSTTIKSQETAL